MTIIFSTSLPYFKFKKKLNVYVTFIMNSYITLIILTVNVYQKSHHTDISGLVPHKRIIIGDELYSNSYFNNIADRC